MAPRMTSRTVSLAARACFSAAARTEAGMPASLVSSCSAVTTCSVPATLKSMSPNASSAPRMSVSVTYWSPSLIRPIAMPETMSFSGTPASSSAMVEAQTEPIEVEPFEPIASETWRIAYGNSSRVGSTGSSARSASAPWPISRRLGEPARPPGGVRREVVVVHVALGAVRVERVDHLLHPEHVQRGHAQDLGLAPLEQRGTVHPGQHADLGGQ